jgi:phosphate acetyltransferase
MTKALFIAPTAPGIGLTSVCLGLVHALDSVGLRVAFCKPIIQNDSNDTPLDHTTQLIQLTTSLTPPAPLAMQNAREWLKQGNDARVMEAVVERVEQARLMMSGGADVVIVEGLVASRADADTNPLNAGMTKALDADVILVDTPAACSIGALVQRLEMAVNLFGGFTHSRIAGCILNRCDAAHHKRHSLMLERLQEHGTLFNSAGLLLLGCIPDNHMLSAPRTIDIAKFLHVDILNEGGIQERRVKSIVLAAQSETHLVPHLLPGVLVITPGDRDAVAMAASLAALNSVELAGILFTEGRTPSPAILNLCRPALTKGLPVLSVASDTYETALQLAPALNSPIPVDDVIRAQHTMDFVATHIDALALRARLQIPHEPRLSPAAFRYQLTQRAHQANKRIVLPEGDEPRTLRAAVICSERKIARCVLLGKPEHIRQVAAAHGIQIPPDVELLDPTPHRTKYLNPLLQMRQHKGLSEERAHQELEDNVVVATLMMVFGEADGLVSGAVHTTANTIRPALQLIKTQTSATLVSSIFFMCLPDQVLVYGDCAINPTPNAEQLADIAIQSADSARAFGIVPCVAMISYSTGDSGAGADVDKVKKATALARQKRPDLLIDGPLQYDAAAIESVGKQKAPLSPVAGHATVFIFPDLNTGNTTYKAVQRAANVVSIGPMLQGLAKPVNDLSRGASVDDIVYTIALTAIQADQNTPT